MSFEPVVDEHTRLIVLGSMPGVESLKMQQYYAHPRNQFWKIIFSLYNKPLEPDYQKRLSFLMSEGIGLWDVIENCIREGSLDSDIEDENVNNFKWLFKNYPGIKYVILNGTKSFDTFKKRIGFDTFPGVIYRKMPSTSPANVMPFETKLNEWQVIPELLKQPKNSYPCYGK